MQPDTQSSKIRVEDFCKALANADDPVNAGAANHLARRRLLDARFREGFAEVAF
jgi:hypothetical protein